MIFGLGLAFFLLAVGQYGFFIFCLLKFKSMVKAFAGQLRLSGDLPGITILVPIKGVLPTFESNFRSLLAQDYPGPLELVLGIKDDNDPVVAKAREILSTTRTRATVKLAIGNPDSGLNPKNSNLARAFAQASHPWIYCSDADVRLDPEHLRRCMAVVKKNPDCFATTMTVNEGGKSLGAMLECVGNNFEATQYFLSVWIKGAPGDSMNGASMFFHRDLLARSGGFAASLDKLTDDLFFGREFFIHGGKGHLVPAFVRETLERQSMNAFWTRFVRWILIASSFRPELHRIGPLFWTWQWLTLFGILLMHPGLLSLAVAAFALRLFSASFAQIALEAPMSDLKNVWVLLIYDCFVPLAWTKSLFQREVVWAGNVMILEKGGVLVRK